MASGNCIRFIPFLVMLLAGCSAELPDEPFAPSEGMTFDTEIAFLLGSEEAAAADGGQATTRDRISEATFVPDGTVVPQGRPPRRIFSSNDWQQVNDVRIYAFRKNSAGNFVYYKPYGPDGTKRDCLAAADFTLKFDISPYAVWWGGDSDTNESHTYAARLRLAAGQYRFLAIARDDSGVTGTKPLTDPDTDHTAWGWFRWQEGVTRLDQATLACSNQSVVAAAELFTGCTAQTLTVDASTSLIRCNITLERAVAGIMMYVENIPATIKAYLQDDCGDVKLKEIRVRSLAVVHGKTVSDQVLLATRGAVDGRLPVTQPPAALYDTDNDTEAAVKPSAAPTPLRVLLKADIPQSALAVNGIYTGTAPDNTAHPNSLLKGAFVMPQKAGTDSGHDCGKENYDKSLYLVFLGYDAAASREVALQWRPIRLASGDGQGDRHYYPLTANHFYAIGCRHYAEDGSSLPAQYDKPVDLRGSASAEITVQVGSFWNEYYGGELGNPSPGIWIDPEWGDHAAGQMQH